MSDEGEECDCDSPIDDRNIENVYSCKECRAIFFSMHQFYLHFNRTCTEKLHLSETDEENETGAQVDSSKEDSHGQNEMDGTSNGACFGKEGSSITPALSTAPVSNESSNPSVSEQDNSSEEKTLDKETKRDPPSVKEMLREMQKKLEEKAATPKQRQESKYNLRRK